MYNDFELCFRYYGKSFTADEYVCGRYADEGIYRIINIVPHGEIASECGKFHFLGNEKIDGIIYGRNVLTQDAG